MPCMIWSPLELLSSLPCLFSFSYNILCKFLPSGICPCSSACWGHSQIGTGLIPTLPSPPLESYLQKAPWPLYFKCCCSSLVPTHCCTFPYCIYNHTILCYMFIVNFPTRISVPREEGLDLFWVPLWPKLLEKSLALFVGWHSMKTCLKNPYKGIPCRL